ncbi:hypothetical protein WN51_03863 [Melipona quadrifasciata]|uniref:Uncharacterized protein n=1 Tax=Melipona quadrifasciata TaxID=166423 RepID=A0A0N0U7X8_9HYME|nr:hypothetical protein WN51_03863 [Melipona quadrifasciata]
MTNKKSLANPKIKNYETFTYNVNYNVPLSKEYHWSIENHDKLELNSVLKFFIQPNFIANYILFPKFFQFSNYGAVTKSQGAIAQYQTTPLLLEVYATPSRESRDPNQPIANFRCTSVAPDFLSYPSFSDKIILNFLRILKNMKIPLRLRLLGYYLIHRVPHNGGIDWDKIREGLTRDLVSIATGTVMDIYGSLYFHDYQQRNTCTNIESTVKRELEIRETFVGFEGLIQQSRPSSVPKMCMFVTNDVYRMKDEGRQAQYSYIYTVLILEWCNSLVSLVLKCDECFHVTGKRAENKPKKNNNILSSKASFWKKKKTSFKAKQMTSLLPFNNFYPVILYRRVQKKKKARNCCIRFGHSLWSANQLPAQGYYMTFLYTVVNDSTFNEKLSLQKANPATSTIYEILPIKGIIDKSEFYQTNGRIVAEDLNPQTVDRRDVLSQNLKSRFLGHSMRRICSGSEQDTLGSWNTLTCGEVPDVLARAYLCDGILLSCKMTIK